MTMAPSGQLAEESTPLEVRFGTSQDQRRVTVLFRLILAIPQFFVLVFIGIAAEIVVFIGWFAALFTGRLPESFARFVLGAIRWGTRVNAYYFMLTDRYPPFSLDADADYPVDVLVTTGRLNRAAVLFRIVLAVPAWIVSVVLSYGMFAFGFITWVITLVLGRMPDALFGASAAAIRYQVRFSAYLAMLTSYYPSDVLGDKGPDGLAYGGTVSGTPPPQPPPPPAGAWAPGPTPAWGPEQQISAPVPPPPAGLYAPPPPVAPGPSTTAPTDDPSLSPSDVPGPDPALPGLPPPPPPPPGGFAPPPPAGAFAPPPPPPPPVPAPTGGPYGTSGPQPPPPPGSGYTGTMPPPPPAPMPAYAPAPFVGGPLRYWPLLLTKSARVMTVVFIIVGALAYLTVFALPSSFSTSSIEGTAAALQVQAAYDTLDTATQTFRSATQSCTASSTATSSELQCLEQADSAWAQAIQAYATQLGQISYPSSAQSEADAAKAAADNAGSIVRSLAASQSAQAYSAASSSQEFTSALDAVDSTSNTLVNTLQGS